MKYDILQILGVAVLVLGAQQAIRLLIDHANSGLLAWLPGGFPAQVEVSVVVAVVVGVVLTAWAHDRAKALGRRVVATRCPAPRDRTAARLTTHCDHRSAERGRCRPHRRGDPGPADRSTAMITAWGPGAVSDPVARPEPLIMDWGHLSQTSHLDSE